MKKILFALIACVLICVIASMSGISSGLVRSIKSIIQDSSDSINGDSINKVVLIVDTVVDKHNNKFIVINLSGLDLQFVEDSIPTDTNVVFCVAAAFSKNVSYSEFSEKEIANDYVVDGVLKHGYDCPIAKNGVFASYNGKYIVEPNKDLVSQHAARSKENHMDSAIMNKGDYFTQALLMHLGDVYPKAHDLFPKSFPANYRCLATDREGNLLFIQALNCSYDYFLHWLLHNESYDIVNAIYLDAGGWSYGFYYGDSLRSIESNKVMEIEQNKKQTNYIVGVRKQQQ